MRSINVVDESIFCNYSISHNQLRLLNIFLTQTQDITLGVALGSATQIAMFVVRKLD